MVSEGAPLALFQPLNIGNLYTCQINANGRIPALVDHLNDGFKVFETAAILLYLASRYDKAHKFSFEAGSNDESEALQWIFFFVGRALLQRFCPIHLIIAWRRRTYAGTRCVSVRVNGYLLTG
jgi:glutathione S-transferase